MLLTIFAEISPLGCLEILEVYEFFDGPRLFSCINRSGAAFFSLWVGTEEQHENYYFVAVSPRRFSSVRSGVVDLVDAFTKAEDDTVMLLQITEPGKAVTTALRPQQLDEELLPLKGEALDLEPLTPSAVKRAAEQGREILELDFSFASNQQAEMPTTEVGSCLRAFGDLFRAASTLAKTPTFGTYLVGATFGSFVVQVAPKAPASNTERASQQRLFSELFRLITSNDQSLIDELLQKRGALAAYKRFLKALSQGPDQLAVHWVSPDRKRREHAVMTRNAAAASLDLISFAWYTFKTSQTHALAANITAADQLPPEEIHRLLPAETRAKGFIIGVFKIIDLEHMRFAIYSPEERELVRGEIAQEAVKGVEGVTLNKPYLVRFEELGSRRILVGLQPAL